MNRVSSQTGTKHRLFQPSATLCPLIFLVATNAVAETSVYRCVTPDGKVEFSQTPCAPEAEELELTVEDRKTGWDPTKTKVEKKVKGSSGSGSQRPKADDEDRATRARQAEKCWKKRQQLEEVNWQLRRGYKPAAGVKLRRRRRSYEEYLGRFCD